MAELVRLDEGELTAEAARDVTDRIRSGLVDLEALIIRAFEGRAWAALGYKTWDEYCTAEFTDAIPRLSIEKRRQLVGALHDTTEMSNRAIAQAVGVDEGTVRNDLRTGAEYSAPVVEDDPVDAQVVEDEGAEVVNGPYACDDNRRPAEATPSPRRVTGTDGKVYSFTPRRQPSPRAREPVEQNASKLAQLKDARASLAPEIDQLRAEQPAEPVETPPWLATLVRYAADIPETVDASRDAWREQAVRVIEKSISRLERLREQLQ